DDETVVVLLVDQVGGEPGGALVVEFTVLEHGGDHRGQHLSERAVLVFDHSCERLRTAAGAGSSISPSSSRCSWNCCCAVAVRVEHVRQGGTAGRRRVRSCFSGDGKVLRCPVS